MKEIVNRLHENRQIELAKSILEAKGYVVSKKRLHETRITGKKGHAATLDGLISGADEDWIYSMDSIGIELDLDQVDREGAEYLRKQGYSEKISYVAKYSKEFDRREYIELKFDSEYHILRHWHPIKKTVNFDEYSAFLKKYNYDLEGIIYYNSDWELVELDKDTKTEEEWRSKVSTQDKSDTSNSDSNHSDADQEEFVDYLDGRYAKDLKHGDGEYVVYKNDRYIGYADSPEEANRMIKDARG